MKVCCFLFSLLVLLTDTPCCCGRHHSVPVSGVSGENLGINTSPSGHRSVIIHMCVLYSVGGGTDHRSVSTALQRKAPGLCTVLQPSITKQAQVINMFTLIVCPITASFLSNYFYCEYFIRIYVKFNVLRHLGLFVVV